MILISKKVQKACFDGGARLMEFTARGDFAHEVFGELTKYAIAEGSTNKLGEKFEKSYFCDSKT